METKIIYNPHCSKCRQTLALIKERGIEPTLIAYLEAPLSKRVLSDIVKKLGLHPRELVRFKEPAAAELGLSRNDKRSKAAWIEILAKNPGLLQRPIVIHGDRAIIGRPPENVLSIL